jgi:hypothetical protein
MTSGRKGQGVQVVHKFIKYNNKNKVEEGRGGTKDDMESQVARKATWKHQGKIGHSATLVSM